MKHDTRTGPQSASKPQAEIDPLESDPRWQLVTRIAESPSLSRAKQLREFLLYSSRWALTSPGKPLSEFEIAKNVMGRRDDFDAAYDNIVRVQATHLRRKLEAFFVTEGRDEETIVTLPKGAYTPVFLPSKPKAAYEVQGLDSERLLSAPTAPIVNDLQSSASHWSFKRLWVLVAFLALVCLVLSLRLFFVHDSARDHTPQKANAQSILTPLLRNGKPVTIVLPDLGLSVVQNLLHREIGPQEYASGQFPGDLHDVSDPKLREALNYIGVRRAISYSELNVVLELVKRLQAAGLNPSVRFARDIHVRDLGTGNIILVGSSRSNPWVSLFADRTNFRFIEDPATQEFSFENQNPQSNEQKRYLPTYTPHGGNAYIDVAILSNATDSGYALLIDGSDAEVNESAVRYLLDGNLPPSLQDELGSPKLKSIELFLRGRHLMNEADNEIQIIGLRQAYRAEQP